MSHMPAARVGDDIAHTQAMSGLLKGLVVGVAVGVLVGATIATGGAALAVVAGVGAGVGLASAGALAGNYIGGAAMGPPTGKFVVGSPNVLINGRPATMTFVSMASCAKESGAPIPLATGSSTVMINIGFAGREGEKLGCSAISVKQTSPDVLIGGDSAADPRVAVTPEVPGWAITGLQALGVAGAIMALPFAIATVGVAATIGGGVLGFVGAHYGAQGGRMLGEALGLSEAGTRALEVAGGFLGGMVGGAAGAKGGQAIGNRAQSALGRRTNPFAGEPALPLGASAKTENFQANRPGGLDMANLSKQDQAAVRTLARGGYSRDTQSQILNSGSNFRIQQGRAGDPMYGFSSKGYAKGADSPYWMDEASFRGMQQRHFDPATGKWNSAGVKNELALPCYNQANAIYRGTLSSDQPLVTSNIGKATETVRHVAADGSTIQRFTRTMTGGGTQVAPKLGGVGGIREVGP